MFDIAEVRSSQPCLSTIVNEAGLRREKAFNILAFSIVYVNNASNLPGVVDDLLPEFVPHLIDFRRFDFALILVGFGAKSFVGVDVNITTFNEVFS